MSYLSIILVAADVSRLIFLPATIISCPCFDA